MSADQDLDAAERLLLALDLFEAGEDLMRAKLRREHPDLSGQQIEDLVAAWLAERPGAEDGDGVGIPREWP